jgi:presenilin-like A22 family membrane protease
MIQRQQTLWLLLAGVFTFLGFVFPFYSGSKQVIEKVLPDRDLNAGATAPLFLFTLLSGVMAFIIIMLYKSRKRQFRTALFGLVCSIVVIFFYYKAIQQYENGHILLSSLFTLAVPLFYILALRGIRHDEKLIKSLDKLR